MTLRSPGALVALLVAACVAGACASPGDGDGSGNGNGPPDGGGGGGGDGGGPTPDAIVLGVDASTGSDAVGDDADDATADPPDVADDSHASKSCTGLPDGTVCGASPDICHDAPVCAGGVCATAAAKADGFVCAAAPDACHDAPVCKAGTCASRWRVRRPRAARLPTADARVQGRPCGAPATKPEGTKWTAGDDTARCCGGKPIHTDVDSDCGACGIQCNASNGESCSLLGGHYFCRGCVASAVLLVEVLLDVLLRRTRAPPATAPATARPPSARRGPTASPGPRAARATTARTDPVSNPACPRDPTTRTLTSACRSVPTATRGASGRPFPRRPGLAFAGVSCMAWLVLCILVSRRSVMRLAVVLGAFGVGVVSLLAVADDARACGGCFHGPTQNGDVITDHRMIFRVTPEQTTCSTTRSSTRGTRSPFAWVLPIHGEVQVGAERRRALRRARRRRRRRDHQVAIPPLVP